MLRIEKRRLRGSTIAVFSYLEGFCKEKKDNLPVPLTVYHSVALFIGLKCFIIYTLYALMKEFGLWEDGLKRASLHRRTWNCTMILSQSQHFTFSFWKKCKAMSSHSKQGRFPSAKKMRDPWWASGNKKLLFLALQTSNNPFPLEEVMDWFADLTSCKILHLWRFQE